MIKIAIWTSGRWDYPYVNPILEELKADDKFDIKVIIPTNHHYRDEIRFGFTTHTIRPIDGIADAGFVYNDVLKILHPFNPDVFIVLGDRFETLMASSVALFLGIPIAHIHGGEDTQGSFDNEIRNAITMMATYHFTSNVKYAENIATMLKFKDFTDCVKNEYHIWYSEEYLTVKEKSDFWEAHIYNVGSPGLNSIDKSKLKSKEELQKEFDIDFNKPYIIACMHPTTKQLLGTRTHITNLVNALYRYSSQVIFVNPNIDPKNEIIREMVIKVASVAFNKWVVCDNIEHTTFLSLMQYADCMVGNSSSGVIEAVEFNLPVINVGNRQQGRVKPNNVFDCGYDEESIFEHLRTIVPKFRNIFESGKIELVNPYKGNGAAKEIVKILKKI